MAKDMELLQKMELTDEARTKLTALLEESKKTKKIASKKLVDALDAVDATEEQTEQFYDVLEAAGVEIDVSDVLDLIGSADGLDSPTLDEIDAIENGELEAAPTEEELANFEPDFVVYNASKAKVENYKELGLNSETCVAFNIPSHEHGRGRRGGAQAHVRGEPSTRRLHRQALRRSRNAASRPHSGGKSRPDEGC